MTEANPGLYDNPAGRTIRRLLDSQERFHRYMLGARATAVAAAREHAHLANVTAKRVQEYKVHMATNGTSRESSYGRARA